MVFGDRLSGGGAIAGVDQNPQMEGFPFAGVRYARAAGAQASGEFGEAGVADDQIGPCGAGEDRRGGVHHGQTGGRRSGEIQDAGTAGV